MSGLVQAWLAARLAATFSAAELADQLASLLCKDANVDDRKVTDLQLVQRRPVPQWAVAGVLLDQDLAPHIFALVDFDNTTVPCVCSEWRQKWTDTEESRRGLRGEASITLGGIRLGDVRAASGFADTSIVSMARTSSTDL